MRVVHRPHKKRLNALDTNGIKKECSLCEQILPLSEFYKCKETVDGYQYRCKTCFKKLMIAYGKEKRRKAHEKKGILCLNEKCKKSVPYPRKKYCSDRCNQLTYQKVRAIRNRESGKAKQNWLKQKAKPGYAEYHREKARISARKRYYLKKIRSKYEHTNTL